MTQHSVSKLHANAPQIHFEVVDSYPHDDKAYTEGLKFYNGFLYESTGRLKLSSLRRAELKTGNILEKISVNNSYFAEGLAILNGEVFQLTEESNLALVYDVKDLNKPAREVQYKGWKKGWGLTDDTKSLILSDSTDALYFIDPKTFDIVGKPIKVHEDDGTSIEYLNELEYARGFIYANVRYSNQIFRIDPKDGKVVGWLDLEWLRPREVGRCVDCMLNGIAYDPDTEHMFVTGKMWPKLFEIRLKD